MRKFALPLMMAACLSLAAPLHADTNLGDVLSGVAKTLLAQEMDKTAYIAAQNANTVSAYRAYLKQYPQGIYRVNAERALAQLGASVDPLPGTPPPGGGSQTAAQQEAALGLSFSQKVYIQQRLTALGYNTHGADGIWGYNTRTAIANWQSANRQPVTAYLTAAQVNLLQGQTGPIITPLPGGDPVDYPGGYSAAQIEASLGLSRTQRIDIQRQLTRIGYDTGIADGLWGSKTRAAIAKWQSANKVTATGYVTGNQVQLIAKQAGTTAEPPPPGGTGNAALEESLLNLSNYEKSDLQQRLTRLGYSTYGADGVFGRNSRNAIAGWQRDEGLAVTGYLTADQVRKIRVETGS